MKAAVLVERGKIEVEERPVPSPGPDELICQVSYTGICGTDLHAYRALSFPLGSILGHELTGRIVAQGTDAAHDRIGERVVIRPSYVCGECDQCARGEINRCVHHFTKSVGAGVPGGFAEFVAVKNYMAIRLPEGVSDEAGTVVEPLACAVHAVRKSRLRLGDRVAVLGSGPIGLLTVACARAAGAEVYAFEPVQARRELATRMGACAAGVLGGDEQGMPGFEPQTMDVVFECAGSPATIAACPDLLRKGGQAVLVGMSTSAVPVDLFRWVEREIDGQASIGSHPDEFSIALDLIDRGVVDVEPLISRVIALDDIDCGGFQALSESRESVKILVGAQRDAQE